MQMSSEKTLDKSKELNMVHNKKDISKKEGGKITGKWGTEYELLEIYLKIIFI